MATNNHFSLTRMRNEISWQTTCKPFWEMHQVLLSRFFIIRVMNLFIYMNNILDFIVLEFGHYLLLWIDNLRINQRWWSFHCLWGRKWHIRRWWVSNWWWLLRKCRCRQYWSVDHLRTRWHRRWQHIRWRVWNIY